MKLIQEEIWMQCNAEGAPQRLCWRRRWYAINHVSERWQYNGDWWQSLNSQKADLQGRQRQYYQVVTSGINGDDCCLEVFEEVGQWVLSRLLD